MKSTLAAGLLFVIGMLFNALILGDLSLAPYAIGFLIGAIDCALCLADDWKGDKK